MSEANKAWRVTVGGNEHEIEVDHSVMTGKIVVKLDGQEVGRRRMLVRSQKIDFDVAGTPATVGVSFAYAGFSASSHLHVANRYVEPLRR